MSTKRNPTHSGSWYSDDRNELSTLLEGWLNKVPNKTDEGIEIPVKGATAIIVPHAGYTYSGPTAAYSFKCVKVEDFDRVFILGPSHHSYFNDCRLSKFELLSTPLGDLKVDLKINSELASSNFFSYVEKDVDEDEHSLEMQLPYLYKIFEKKIDQTTFIPIMVGDVNSTLQKKYGEILSSYLKDSKNLFVISSDFCHWGKRFGYEFYSTSQISSQAPGKFDESRKTIPIYEAIENLDREAMNIIETLSFSGFKEYLKITHNTICGRHPISIFLAMLEHAFPSNTRNTIKGQDNGKTKHEGSNPILRFIHYEQSSKVTKARDSSVSYASAYFFNPNS